MEILIPDLSETPRPVIVKSSPERGRIILRVDDVDYPMPAAALTDAVNLCARNPD